MAVGRRKRFYNGSLPTSLTTLVTAAAAPADGSAAASVRICLCNVTGGAIVATITVNSLAIINALSIAANSVYTYPETIDLMGGEIIQGSAANTNSINGFIFGVEAKDS